MRALQQFAGKSLILMLVATSGLLIRGVPTSGADPEPEKGPRALLQVVAHAPEVSFTKDNESADYNRYLQTQLARIKSRSVINAALQQPEVSQLAAIRKQPDPVAWLEQNLESINVNGSELVQVSLSPRSGANGNDQAAIINAIVSVYVQEVTGAEGKRQADRREKLKKIRNTYTDLLKERREHARRLTEALGKPETLSGVEQSTLAHHRERLLDQRFKLRLDRAEAETLLGRRQNAANRESDAVRKEIAQLEDRLAILTAHEKVLQEELKEVSREQRNSTSNALDLKEMNEEVAQMEAAALTVGSELEALNIALSAPPRVRVIENATPPKQ
jgi:hypothetical protein